MGLLVVRPDNSLNEAIQNAANTIFNAWYKKYLLDLQHQQELEDRKQAIQAKKELLNYQQQLDQQERNKIVNDLYGYDTPTINLTEPQVVPNNPIDIQAQKMINPDYQQPLGLTQKFMSMMPKVELGQEHVKGLFSDSFINKGIPTAKDYVVAQAYGVNLPKVEKPKVVKTDFIDLGDRKVAVAVIQNPDGSVNWEYDKEMVKGMSPKEREYFRLKFKEFKEKQRHNKVIEQYKGKEIDIKKKEVGLKEQEIKQKQDKKKEEQLSKRINILRNRIKDTINRFKKLTGNTIIAPSGDFTQLDQGEVKDIIKTIRNVNPDIANQLERDYILYYQLTNKLLGIKQQNKPMNRQDKRMLINQIDKKLEEFMKNIDQMGR
ncbi:hypothetical protein [Hydrogenivirga sp. 128-5-R1-1]|uniref:hypothetical protein n=1 Tax=Hydrogenivirga sp. 128-5-R1-1 TaxID=392423 RepID=UPI00015F3438|nr:hypothetical protein [Hydrogenivirga sp. 128-5-R1-1]EDP74382.1 hypothetical protein HG1285_12932 [Hydrogenivirga sp. 128-5-R1-1]